jgi:hypothetical protein
MLRRAKSVIPAAICMATLLVLLPSHARADVNDGIVGFWRFNNADGQDSSGFGNHGTLMPGATFVTGHDGQPNSALHGHAPGHYGLTVPDSASLSVNGSMTMAGWVNQDVPFASGDLFNKYFHPDSGYSVSYTLYLNDPNYPLINGTVYGQGSAADRGMNRAGGNTMAPSQGVWYHFAFVYTTDQSANFSMLTYVNGVLQDMSGYLGTQTYSIFDGIAPLYLGSPNIAVDDMIIYNRALSPEEITQIAPEPSILAILVVATASLVVPRSRSRHYSAPSR